MRNTNFGRLLHMKAPLLGLSLLFALINGAHAEIYKYRDANGNWQFADKPPRSQSGVEVVRPPATTPTTNTGSLLNPVKDGATPLQRAANAVVSIRSQLGSGSGFFVNENGYLLTNRHVVRPAENANWKAKEKALSREETRLSTVRRALNKEQAKLNRHTKKLSKFRRSVDKINNQSLRAEKEAKYASLKDNLDGRKKTYRRKLRAYQTQKRKLSDKRSEIGFNSALSATANHFNITLKNGEKKRAKLVSLSNTLDLALLKIDHHRTEFLRSGDDPRQGQKVYAIGSPMGIRDIITSGILSRVENDVLITDSKILPGNSGGPLIDANGNVLGINTAKAAKNVYHDGLGLAIPYQTALQEFSGKLN